MGWILFRHIIQWMITVSQGLGFCLRLSSFHIIWQGFECWLFFFLRFPKCCFISGFLTLKLWEGSGRKPLNRNPLEYWRELHSSYPVIISWRTLINQTPRIPYSCCFCCSCSCSVTKSTLWQYLGNQAWYHRSTGVKTTGKILNKKIQNSKKKMSKMVKNCQKWSKWSKMVQNGSKWSKMVKNGEKGWKMVKIAKNGQNGQKWSKWSKIIQNGSKWS